MSENKSKQKCFYGFFFLRPNWKQILALDLNISLQHLQWYLYIMHFSLKEHEYEAIEQRREKLSILLLVLLPQVWPVLLGKLCDLVLLGF